MAADRLAYMEWSVDPNVYDPADPACWAQANPAFGIRISEDFVAAERDAMPAPIFDRERLGIPDPAPAEMGVIAIDQDAWMSSFDGRSSAAGVVTFGLDVGRKGFAAIATAGARADGLLHVEVLEHAETGEWLVGRAAGLCAKWKTSLLLDPSSGASSYLPDLVAAGVPVVALTRREVAGACGRFLHFVREGKVRHHGTGELNAAVATAVTRKMGESFVWDMHTDASPDLSPLYAVTLAAWPTTGEPVKSALSF